MKIRNGFVSNSSSSSFIVCYRSYIKNPEEILEYIKSHEECTGMIEELGYDGRNVYFDIKRNLRTAILKHPEVVSKMVIVDGFQSLEEDFKVTPEMIDCEIFVESGWDGIGCDSYEEYDFGSYSVIVEALFKDLPEDQYDRVIDLLRDSLSI